jgi:hypothetical protein
MSAEELLAQIADPKFPGVNEYRRTPDEDLAAEIWGRLDSLRERGLLSPE